MSTLYLDQHGTSVGAKRGRLTLRAPDGVEMDYPLKQIDRVVVLGHVHFSHDALWHLLRLGIPTVFSSPCGGYRGCLASARGSRIQRRLRQIDAARDHASALTIARALVEAKVRGQMRVLHQWRVGDTATMARHLRTLTHCATRHTLMGHEGAAARLYFAGMRDKLAGTPYTFTTRRFHPPPDPVNAVLSLLYALMTSEISLAIAASGLDPCVAYLHGIEEGRESLSLDLVEPLRPLADRLAVRLLRHHLQPDDFVTQGGVCQLRDGRRGKIYEAWASWLDERVQWRGEATKWRQLIHLQPLQLVRHLESDSGEPLFWHLDAH